MLIQFVPTATKSDKSVAQQIPCQVPAPILCKVQVIPSGEVLHKAVFTAQNNPNEGDHAISAPIAVETLSVNFIDVLLVASKFNPEDAEVLLILGKISVPSSN